MATGSCHVLIVDDEKDFRETLGMVLQSCGYRVSEAGSGDEALELLVKHRLQPDVVLLDHRMPGPDGAETLGRIRAQGLGLPVLLVSAAQGLCATAAARGFTGAVLKPFSAEQLLECIERVVSGPQPERDGAARP